MATETQSAISITNDVSDGRMFGNEEGICLLSLDYF